jgi:hypothetical protein
MKLFTYYKGNQILWFRLFGYGLSIKSNKHGFIPFSIRYGYRKTLNLFGYRVEFLKPEKRKTYGRVDI